MALTLARDKLVDRDGAEYSPEFVTKYGIPSWTVHADAVGIVEIFPRWNDDDDWTIVDDAFVGEQFINVTQQVLHTVFDHLRAVCIHYGLDFSSLERLAMRSLEIRERERGKWGS